MTVEPKQTKFNVKEEILEKAKKIKKSVKHMGFPCGHPSRY